MPDLDSQHPPTAAARPSRRPVWLALATMAVVVAVASWTAATMRVETEITEFLPAEDDRELAQLVAAVTRSDLTRTVTLTVQAEDLPTAARAAATLGAELEGASEVAWVRWGPDEDLERAFYEAYFPRRLGLLADRPEDVDLSAEALRVRLDRLRTELGGPTGPFLRRIAPEDPWMVFIDYVERLRTALEGELEVRDGAFVSQQGDDAFGVVLLASNHSPFDGVSSRALLSEIDAAFEATEAAIDAPLTLELATVHRIAVQSEKTIKADIQRVSIFGSLAVLLLLLVVFRDLRTLLLAGFPLFGGVAAGATAVHVGFGSIHGLTLAFGATLVGVALDYVAHLLNHHYLAPDPDGAVGTARHLRPGLLLGAGTTVAGLIGLAWTSFPGIRQMAIFTSVGVVVAVLLTLYVLPPLLPAAKTTPLHARIGRWCAAFLERAAAHRGVLLALPLIAIAIAITGSLRLEWQDDIRALNPTDPDLLAEDARVRGRVANLDLGRFLVARGDTFEEALERNDALHDLLNDEVRAGRLERFRSLHALLPSVARQRSVRDAIDDGPWARTETVPGQAGFVPAIFAPFHAPPQAAFEPLPWEDLQDGPLARLASMHRVPLEDGVGVLTFLRGADDADALAERAESIDGVRSVDQGALMQRAYKGFRTRTLELMVVGLFIVLLIVLLRYRRLRPALAAYLPALCAAGATLGLLGWFGIPANLLHVVTLLLVLSMGVDYGVFMVESERGRADGAARNEGAIGDGPATVVSLLMACLSTVASFGILAMSESGALQALGLTAAIGVALSLILAPAAWLILRR